MKVQVHPGVYSMQDQLNLIAKQVDKSHKEPQVRPDGSQYMLRDMALEIVRGCPQHGFEAEHCQVNRVFHWVKSNIEYRHDPVDYDLFMTAGRTINTRASDCDDHTILVCSMLSSIGVRTGAKIISPDGSNWHIYPVAAVKSHLPPHRQVLIPLDTTQTESYPGWEPSIQHRKYAYLATFVDGRADYRKVRN